MTFLTEVTVKITSTVTFMKSYKIIEDKILQWRNKADKEAYLAQFSFSFDKIFKAFKTASAGKDSMHLSVKSLLKANKTKLSLWALFNY